MTNPLILTLRAGFPEAVEVAGGAGKASTWGWYTVQAFAYIYKLNNRIAPHQ